MTFKMLITLSILAATLCCGTRAHAATAYTNWPATADWTELTNHITWCYSAITQRNEAAKANLSTNDFAPTFVCPYWDYIRFARAIDRLATNFVCQTNAVSTDFALAFSNHFTTATSGVFTNDFPMWSTSNLHLYAFGTNDWSTNAVLHSWMTVTNRDIRMQVQSAITNLMWTRRLVEPQWSYPRYTSQSNQVLVEAVGQDWFDFAPAYAEECAAWDSASYAATTLFNCSDDYYSVIYDVSTPGYQQGRVSATRIYAKPVLENCYTGTPVSVSWFLFVVNRQFDEEGNAWQGVNPFNYDTASFWPNIDVPHMVPIADLGMCSGPTIVGDYPFLASMSNNPALSIALTDWPASGYEQYMAYSAQAYWLLKWQFTNTPPALTSLPIVEDPDTDRDDLSDPGVDLNSAVTDTGTIVWRAEHDQPHVAIPLAVTPSWYGGPPVYAYLSQGGSTNLPYQYLVPGVDDEDGPYQAYSFATRVLESGAKTNDIPIKQVAVLRPRGNTVIFGFPWNGTAFSTLGYPTGINSNRTYVLRDATPTNDTDLCYDLLFASGVTHQFNGGITNILLANGLAAAVATNSIPGGTVSFPATASDARYNAELTWTAGMVSQAAYKTKDDSQTIAVTVSGDGAGHITGLSKSGGITDIAKGNASVSGGTITYAWGTVVRQPQDAPAGQARTVTLKTVVTGCSDVDRETKFNANDRPWYWKTSSTVSGNSLLAETTAAYYDTAGRHINGLPRNSRIESLTLPDKSTRTYTYDGEQGNDTGWLLTETTPVSASLSRTVAYDYFSANGGTPANTSNLVERPRCVTVKLNNTAVAKTLYAHTGASQTIAQECVTPAAAWDAAGNLVTTRSAAIGGLSNGLPTSVVGPAVSSTWTYGIDGVSGGSFNAIGTLTATEARNTGVTAARKVNAFGYLTDKTVRESAGSGQSDHETYSAHAGNLDAFGRPGRMDYKGGTWETFGSYCIWGPKDITRRDKGTVTVNTFSDFGVATGISETAPSRTVAVSTDPLGLQASVTVTQGGRASTVSDTKDLLGRPLTHSDPLSTRGWSYADNGNGYWTITLSQSGLDPITVKTFADGSISKVYGTGARQCVGYALSVDGNSQPTMTATALDAAGGALSESATVACNAFGQPVSAQQSGVGQAMSFDYKPNTALPWHATDESGVRVAASWNNYIGIEQFGVKMDANDDLAPASQDRMFRFGRTITDAGETATAATYETNGSENETAYASFYASHDGKQAAMWLAGQSNTITVSDYADGGLFTVDTSSTDGTATHEAYAPSGQILAMEVTDAQSGTNRQITVNLSETQDGQVYTIWDSSSGTEVLTFDTAGRLASDNASGSGGQNTTVGYLAGTDLPTSMTGGGKSWSCQYHPNGLPSVVSASGSPTAQYSWDTQGRLHTLTLNLASNRSSTTTWNRHAETGRLTSKTVNNATAETYTWKPNGQPDTITRPTGTVVYQYNTGGVCTAMVDTPAGGSAETITIGRNRQGQKASSTVAGGVGETYARRVDGTLSGVQVTGGVVPGYTLDLPKDVASGRSQGFTLTQDGLVRTAVVSYDASGKATNLVDGAVAANYRWTPGGHATNLVVSVAGTPVLTFASGWNEAMGLRTNLAAVAGGSAVASFAYQRGPGTSQISRIVREDGSSREASYDGGGRLAGWKHKDAAGVADYDRCWLFGYDGADNLVSAGRDPTVSGGPSPMSPMAREYATRNIRTASVFSPDDCNFIAERRWNAVDLVCYAAANASVTVNGLPARRNGTRFVVSIPLASNTVATVTNLTVCAVVSGGTNIEYYTTNTVLLTLPAYPESIETAVAGAVTSDSVAEYLYDARNQLRRVTDKAGATAERLQSTYDYYPDGRRARKTVTTWDGSAWQPRRTCQYIYQGWNLVREVVSNSVGTVTTRDFAWGLDLSGVGDGQWGQAAGGIGGLLAITEVVGTSTNVFLPVCDHAGTVHSLVAAMTNSTLLATPVVVASYEYSPFGELIAVDGPFANSCPFGFQSKYRDSETGLVYFGKRYYDPKMGKFITSDPLQEQGGLNLTAFCENDPINKVDYLGMATLADVLKKGTIENFAELGTLDLTAEETALLLALGGIAPVTPESLLQDEVYNRPYPELTLSDSRHQYGVTTDTEALKIWAANRNRGQARLVAWSIWGAQRTKKMLRVDTAVLDIAALWATIPFIIADVHAAAGMGERLLVRQLPAAGAGAGVSRVMPTRQTFAVIPRLAEQDARAGIDYSLGSARVSTTLPQGGEIIWVQLPDGSFRFALRSMTSTRGVDPFPHPILSGGRPVVGAGEAVVKDGRIVYINSVSGHYRPQTISVIQSASDLTRRGLTAAEFGIDTSVNRAALGTALIAW